MAQKRFKSGNVKKRNARTGSRFDDFLKEEGIFEEVQAKALKRALAEQLQEGMQTAKLTKLDMAGNIKRASKKEAA